MALDDDGSVIWQHDLPQNLNKHYTASEIASFSRWYLDDWPVFCWTADYGLFVAAVPRGSVWKYNIYNNEQLMNAMAAGMLPALALLLGVAAACCLLFSWRGARRLQTIAAGLATVADGGTIRLPTDGFAGELADTVNRTSEQLRRRNEIIARRDDARTSWIAGVSHDVRTPLALILGWAEQLEQDTALPAAARQKACGIRTQSEKLRTLIEDLNLTSKLQYGAQPLRCRPTQAGPLLRRLAAEFCDSPLHGGVGNCTRRRQGDSGRGRRAAGPRSGKPAAQCGLPQPRPCAGAAFRGAHRKNTEDHDSRRRRGLPARRAARPADR